ncbi:MAG: type II toxin-antitoxin system Y4mF family antitoxin [Pseudomonadota bacterium]
MESKLSNIVKEHRKRSGLSQIELARIAGVGKTVVFDIEHGKESVRLNTLLKVLNVLNIQIIFKGPFINNEDKR